MAAAIMDDTSSPMSELNTTPLIDVMLVLLIMFIMTIPVATHSVDIDLPTDCAPRCDTPLTPDPVKNKIVIEPQGTIFWNGTEIDQGQLATLLRQTMLMDVEPELQFEPAASTAYGLSASVLNIIKSSGVTKFGFVGNERYRQFERDNIPVG